MPFTKIMITWESVLAVTLTLAYTYIFIMVTAPTRIRSNSNTTGRQLNLKVPIAIVVSFFCLYLIPDFLLVLKQIPFTPWLYVIFLTDSLTNSIAYVLGTTQIKDQLCCNKTNSSRNSGNGGEHNPTEPVVGRLSLYTINNINSSSRISNQNIRNEAMQLETYDGPMTYMTCNGYHEMTKL